MPSFLLNFLIQNQSTILKEAIKLGVTVQSFHSGYLKELKVPFPSIDIQKQIIGQIEEEQTLIDANKRLIEIFEQKVKGKIAEVWGEMAVSEVEVKMPQQLDANMQEQRVKQAEVEQAELDLHIG